MAGDAGHFFSARRGAPGAGERMVELPAIPADDERLAVFTSVRDLFRYAVSRFNGADLAYGHGATNAVDEAAFIVLEGLKLPIDALDPFLDARLTRAERARLIALIDARVPRASPPPICSIAPISRACRSTSTSARSCRAASSANCCSTASSAPARRSTTPGAIESALDLCAGGGSLAILAARVFANAQVDAVELSADALAVARRNVEEHDLADRVTLYQGDLFAPLGGKRYDLILANPPYVDAESLAAFPPEYAAEPRLAHAGGRDGLDIVRRILAEAGAHMTQEGALVCEVGRARARLEAAYPDLPFLWLDAEESEAEGEVFVVRARDLAPRKRAKRG